MSYKFRAWLFNIAIILAFANASAQDAKTPYVPLDVKTSVDSFKNNVNVEFKIDSEEDVLVVVTDSSGITVFLENQFRFKGIYKKSIDLPYKGKFNLNVMREKERTNKSFEVR